MPTIYYKRNTGDFFNATLIYEDVGTGFRVGNEWQWENFTMGCDWVGVSQPIYSNVKEDKFIPSAGSPDYDRRQYVDEQNRFVKDTNINLLRVYAGASF